MDNPGKKRKQKTKRNTILKTKDVHHRPHRYRVNQCAPDG
jgi:hypothetical protein